MMLDKLDGDSEQEEGGLGASQGDGKSVDYHGTELDVEDDWLGDGDCGDDNAVQEQDTHLNTLL